MGSPHVSSVGSSALTRMRYFRVFAVVVVVVVVMYMSTHSLACWLAGRWWLQLSFNHTLGIMYLCRREALHVYWIVAVLMKAHIYSLYSYACCWLVLAHFVVCCWFAWCCLLAITCNCGFAVDVVTAAANCLCIALVLFYDIVATSVVGVLFAVAAVVVCTIYRSMSLACFCVLCCCHLFS